MKEDIHPKYQKTKIKCACGQTYEVGSTKEDIEIEICSNCHPFYTGEDQLVDTAGRAEKFEKRRQKAKEKRAEMEKQKNKQGEGSENNNDEPEKTDETEELAQKAKEKLN